MFIIFDSKTKINGNMVDTTHKATESIIWNFDIPIKDYITIKLPEGAIIFDLIYLNGMIKLFCVCNTNAKPEERELIVLQAGVEFSEQIIDYIGTVSILDGNLIYHIFEIDNSEDEES